MTRARGPRLVLLGKQGAGKGTQVSASSEHYGVAHLSTGELFRAAAAAGSPAGLEAKAYMDRGELVPDDIVIEVVDEHFASPARGRARLRPRRLPAHASQAEELDQILDGHPLDLVARPRRAHRDRPRSIAGGGACARTAAPTTT